MKIPLLIQVICAVCLGLLLGHVLPVPVVRVFMTFNGVFSEYLSFTIPLIILSLVAAGIAGLGAKSGWLLLTTVAIAYGSTLFSGFMTYFSCAYSFPNLLAGVTVAAQGKADAIDNLAPFFDVNIEPIMSVMTALVMAFMLGMGTAVCKADTMKKFIEDLQKIIETVIQYTIIPLLPLFIFGIFLLIAAAGKTSAIVPVFGKVIVVVIILHVALLLIQYSLAGAVAHRNPFKLLWNMLPAYATALGTSSSAATIPVTLRQTLKNGVDPSIANFCVPLCATIHLAGSTLKITAFAMAVVLISGGALTLSKFAPFICLLGITMIAAPGVPGGAIMAATALLQSVLGFNDENVALMITLYIATDSFGTACNVCGDGAIAVVVNRISGKSSDDGSDSNSGSDSGELTQETP
ncbi:MAG: dicarboxylate/amino acid:cation symporter [Thermoguttaceae bacterium]|nr:dicarboxylate/amino acid:cation symporter [Thermoguttaceae bacterium]